LPFLVIPLLTRALGVDGFGKYALYLGLANLLLVVIRFGFEFSATRAISINADNQQKLSGLISAVLMIKSILLCCTLLLFVGLVIFVKPDPQLQLLIVGGGLLLAGQMLLPVWYFQGLQQMKFVTFYTVITKIIYVLLLFLLIREQNDYGLAVLVYGASFFIAGVCSVIHMLKKTPFSLQQGKLNIKEAFKEALPFFTSRAFVMAYTSSMVPLIGFVCSNAQVSIYAASEKLYNALQSLMYPLANALYPHIAKEKDVALFNKLFVFSILLLILVSIAGYFVAPYLIVFLFGSEFAASIGIFNIHLIALVFVFPSIMLGYPLLAALGFSKEANGSVVIGAITFFFIAAVGMYLNINESEYFVWGVVAAELVVFMLRAYFSLKLIWINKLHIQKQDTP
jgi:PST family polysaccharide transporter